ncbi:MAG: ACT domain-containing protein [Gemmatimonadaceae bacterium]
MKASESIQGIFAVCQLDAGAGIPHWCVHSSGLLAIVRTDRELTVVCEEHMVPGTVRAERGFVVYRIAGTIDFAVTGVLAALTAALADAGVSVFALSTFDTDYVLVRAGQRERAEQALASAGYPVA